MKVGNVRKQTNDKSLFIDSFIEQCAGNGIAATKLADVASKLGYSSAMVNVRFGSKDGLTIEAADYVLEKQKALKPLTAAEERFTIQIIAQATHDKRLGQLFAKHGLTFAVELKSHAA